jgi:probable F420-dependent oxidoreductase
LCRSQDNASLKAVRFAVGLPTQNHAGIADVAREGERLGFAACYVTDHPFPSHRWLYGGGHRALDPFVALSFVAAATTTLRLQTHILVLPYRNPFLAAKSVLSLDVLSGGRVILGVAAGYLKEEFAALGAPFEERQDVSDEAILAMKLAWASEDVHYAGRGFRAAGNSYGFRPVQTPHPPVWGGGNSKRAIRRAVELCDGWVPFPNSTSMARHTRTDALETVDDLGARVAYAREHARTIGRTTPLDICYSVDPSIDPVRTLDTIGQLHELGVTWLTVEFADVQPAAYVRSMERFARDVLVHAG